MKSIGIIPARFASSRFPGKPLVQLGGMSLIQGIYQRAQTTQLDEVIVATDDERIYQHVKDFGGAVMMTSTDHRSGTDRCAEVAAKVDADVVVNIQGDEPFFPTDAINEIILSFQERTAIQIVTLSHLMQSEEAIFSKNVVKVVFDQHRKALYFSRSPIPFLRDIPPQDWHLSGLHHQHIGIYAFRSAVLQELTVLSASSYEMAESLEQLRWLQAGYSIHVIETDSISIGIDTPEDLRQAEKYLRS